LEAQCLTFYRDVLRLSELEKPEHLRARGGAWFQVGPTQVHIGIDTDASPRSKRHICFLVCDLAQARAEVASRGGAIEDEGIAEGLRRFFVRDPAGNRIEIGQRC
jgi:catechol 2,3-dioxygenase-like lactoylglutathione lyase family enzyme